MWPKRITAPGRQVQLAGVLILALTTLALHGENNSNYIFHATTTNFGGAFTIGASGGTNNLLEISNGGAVTNTTGNLGNGSFNLAFVTNANSMWVNQGELRIGWNTASARSNALFVGDNGYVESVGAHVGHLGFYNTAILTGPGSRWTNNGTLTVGLSGGFNTFIVTNEGRVVSTATVVGSSGASNTLIVTGAGTIYTNTANFIIGSTAGGTHNSLYLLDGAQLHNVDGRIGGNINAAASNNYALISGLNTLWNNTGRLTVGNLSANNLLVVSNGALVVSRNSNLAQAAGIVGSGTDATNNLAIVTGGGSTWSNTAGITVGGAGAGNQLTISAGGTVHAAFANLGSNPANTGSNVILVTGSDSLLNLAIGAGSGLLSVDNGIHNQITISDGGRLNNIETHLGETLAGSDTTITVTGAGSVWSNSGTMYVGYRSPNNRVFVEDGGRVDVDTAYVGYLFSTTPLYRGTGNVVQVSGSNSTFNANLVFVGYDAPGNTFVVTNGGKVFVDASSPSASSVALGQHAIAASNNTVIVTGAGSLWTNTGGITIGVQGGRNSVIVSDGGRVDSTFVNMGTVAGFAGEFNSVLITGSNSTLNVSDPTSLGFFQLGAATEGNSLVVSNGGRLIVEGRTIIGLGAAASNSTAVVTGPGSLWQSGTTVQVGRANSTITVSNGGTLEATRWHSGVNGGGTISNTGGIYQFATAAPIISTTVDGGISISGGTISYRDVTGANIHNDQVSNITFSGNNAFRLNHATNASVPSYTFDSLANTSDPRNYQRLVLTNGSRWISGNLTVGTGGAVRGGAEDVVEITGNFTIERSSNPSAEFDLASSTVLFSGETGHTNAVTGLDFGHDGTNGFADGFTAVNFSYGTLSLGSTNDHLYFLSGDGALSNALYVLHLDLFGDTNFVANLHSPTNINIYYGISSLAPDNAYLNDLVYTLDGGGLLLPAVPEPSLAALLAVSAVLLLRRRARSG